MKLLDGEFVHDVGKRLGEHSKMLLCHLAAGLPVSGKLPVSEDSAVFERTQQEFLSK